MKLGIVGLGQMGKPIAVNLAKSGAAVVAVNRSTDAFADLQARGIATTTDVAQLAQADIVFLCLPHADAVRQTLFGDAGGLAECLEPGTTVVDLSTIDHGSTLEFAALLSARGIELLDAPISGMEARTVDGTLTVMCGGDALAFDKVLPHLWRIGTKVLHMGPTGSGQLAKLINQLLFDINAAALAELLPMAVKLGLDPEKIAGVVNSGTGRSHASEFFIPRMLEGRFDDGYPMESAYKDLVGGARLSADMAIPMPVLAAATATYQTALRRGHGLKDKGAMVLVFEELLGVAFRSKNMMTKTDTKETT